ncbi:hypothetical protein [Microseira sp. BLCC-F43]|jgi:hypothetical protein|uniref:hypothetical protein n=1 Tax=Microseira sp. BLCC-F43 TaxID=3153602 RepID=UPI0035BB7446
MLIADLPYFETVPSTKLITGAAGTSVTADALALGDKTYTLAFGNTTAKPLPNSGSISIGTGIAVAIGDYTKTGVTVAGDGDIVVASTTSTPNLSSKPISIAVGVVVAIDLPG